jgi:hypothetical protein
MSAGRDYRLVVRRGGLTPALLADSRRVDHVELVEVATGETALFWKCSPTDARRLARELRADLRRLDSPDFIARWTTVER